MHFVAFWKEMAKELWEEYSPRQGDQAERIRQNQIRCFTSHDGRGVWDQNGSQ